MLDLALLLPPTRALVRGALARRLLQRIVVSMAAPRGAPASAPRRPRRDDVEGTAVDVDPAAPAPRAPDLERGG